MTVHVPFVVMDVSDLHSHSGSSLSRSREGELEARSRNLRAANIVVV